MIGGSDAFGPLELDRRNLVEALLFAFIEGQFARLDPLERLSPLSFSDVVWKGTRTTGSALCDQGNGDYDLFGWNEAGLVGFSLEVGFGPQRELAPRAEEMTGKLDDLPGLVPRMPTELQDAFDAATDFLAPNDGRLGERLRGAGLWLTDDHAGGSLFDSGVSAGPTKRLGRWGRLESGRWLRFPVSDIQSMRRFYEEQKGGSRPLRKRSAHAHDSVRPSSRPKSSASSFRRTSRSTSVVDISTTRSPSPVGG